MRFIKKEHENWGQASAIAMNDLACATRDTLTGNKSRLKSQHKCA